MDSGTSIAAAVAAAVCALGLRQILKGRKPGPPPSPENKVIDHKTLADAVQQEARLDLALAFTDSELKNLRHRPRPSPAPAHIHTSDDAHARRLVTGIASQHPLTLFADLTHPDATEQAAILTDLLGSASLAPYSVDTSRDAALRLGLPIAPDHPAPLMLYIKGVALGDFIASIDALRTGQLATRLTQADLAFDPAALSALQDSLQKA